ncbi:polymorphic toxin-type HINT domain-containing protein [Actinoplanes rectilineatus]|uniref:polymorphic toxin-type HINT domain-containing protein n=1 Tax=Actinoplanes rectilineatus TaxID=113571 RepID=UPI001FDF28F2|nr:polymorphic toxin-type HINT domain-containing protein [Actinoplanes rectilineatus]
MRFIDQLYGGSMFRDHLYARRTRRKVPSRRLLALATGLAAVTLLPQAVSVPAAAAERLPVAARSLTLAEAIEMERVAAQQSEQRLLAQGPIDEFELNRMLIQDLADYDEDPEVRAAAAAVLLTEDPDEFIAFLDKALPIYRAVADERKKQIAAANRVLVAGWAETGGPILRERAAAVLATNNDLKIADFVAIGKEAAVAADKQDELNAAEQAKLIKARVVQIVAAGGYEVSSAGQMALDSEDPATIAEFYNTGYKAASARDAAAQTQIEAALAARSQSLKDLIDLANRATRAATARTTIIESSVAATQSLTITANSMLLTNRYAKQADAIYAADLPIRKAGGQTHTADLTRLSADACAEAVVTARNADQVAAHAGVADTAARVLMATGLSNGVDWAEVLMAQSEAATAAKLAADTVCSATKATEAAGKTLDADRNATIEMKNAVKYREAAERNQATATKLADQAEKLATAAKAAEADARKQRLRAEQDAQDAWAKAQQAEDHYNAAVVQRNIARQQMSIAVVQQTIALSAAQKAVAQQEIASEKGLKAQAAGDELNASAKRFEGLASDARNKAVEANKYINERNTKELSRAAHAADAIAKAGTAEGDKAAEQVRIIDAQLPGLRAAETAARGAANTAAAAADAAAVAAQRAAAAAAAARAEADAAAAAAAGAKREAQSAANAANKAIADAQKANEYARQAVNTARAAVNQAVAAKANAELTQSAADAAVNEAGIASFQSRVAGRNAVNARVSALALAEPVAVALDIASYYAETDNDAAMAIDIAHSALLISTEQSTQAEQHAVDAEAAAVHAAEMALKAQDQVKPAYEAAKKAAEEAERAIRASKVAIDAAIGAAAEAKGAVTAAKDAAAAAKKAAAYAAGADRVATEAGHDAAVARQAANSARSFANTAEKAADNVSTITKKVTTAAAAAKKVADAMKLVAVEMTNLANNLTGAVDQVAELSKAEKQARQTAWMQSWRDSFSKFIDGKFDDPKVREYLKSINEGAVESAGGIWLSGLCAFGPGGNSPGNTPDSEEACDMLVEGVKGLIQDPGSLIHLEEWQNGEYAKFLGLWTYDIASLVIPKVSKVAGGIRVLESTLTDGLKKLLNGDLMAGIKKFGADAMDAALKDLGAINVAKLLDLDVDLPDRLKFTTPELKALKAVVDSQGFSAVEAAIRGLDNIDINLTDLLEGLLKACTKGRSFTPETPVLMADGSTKGIASIRLGDQVLATDPLTGRTSARPVTALHRNLDERFADVTVTAADGSRAIVRTTSDHPFWNVTDQHWDDAAALDAGDALLAHDGEATVAGVHRHWGSRDMFDLTVADVHTYYVLAGRTPVLVHNEDCINDPDIPRYGENDLAPAEFSPTSPSGEPLRVGSDANTHFVGDPIGTWRDVNGKLHDTASGEFISSGPTKIDVTAVPGKSTTTNAASDAGVKIGVEGRKNVFDPRKDIWDKILGPIATKLSPKGIIVNEASMSPKRMANLLEKAEPYLTGKELLDLGEKGKTYNELTVDLRDASQDLGTAGGDYVARTEFPTAKKITPADDAPGTSGNLDRVLFDESNGGRIIVIEEKGAGSNLGSRLVRNPKDLTGPYIRAQQMSTAYLRHMLQYDNKLGPLLAKDAVLRGKFQRVLDGNDPKQIIYLQVKTSPTGLVTTVEYELDFSLTGLGRGVISIAGTP